MKINLIDKDAAFGGWARVSASTAAIYALIATVSGGDPTAAGADIAATQEVGEKIIDLAFRIVEQWPLLIAAAMPLWSKFSKYIPWIARTT